MDGWKLNGTHSLLVYADYVYFLGGNAHTIKKNAEALLVASKEIGLEVNADKTKYLVMSRDQNAEHQSTKIEIKSFERVYHSKHL